MTKVGALAIFPVSKAGAERFGVDPLATLPLERLPRCARARLTYGAELVSLADRAARVMDGDEWQPHLEALDRDRAALAAAYRRLLGDAPEEGR